jgi:alkylation response protein AidB-like acyl-CoA dehydrogenase
MARRRAFGSLELDPVSMFRVVEEMARHDSAAGWTLQLSVAVDACLAWLPDVGAAAILEGHPDVIFGASFTPTGGRPCRWQAATGSPGSGPSSAVPMTHVGSCSSPASPPRGRPCRFGRSSRPDHARILDTWHTMGMRGTGSHDVAVTDGVCA